MKVTILGTGAAYPGAGEACAGFLVEERNIKLLVDCGTGVLSNLQKFLYLSSVSDIVITHMHADHFFDLIPYRYALYYGVENSNDSKPRLYLPPGGIEVLDQVTSPFAETDSFFSDVFDVSEYDSERLLQLEDLALQFVPVKHYIPTYGLTVTSDKKLAYSSDSGMCKGIRQVAKDADLFICNVGACLDKRGDNDWGHMAPAQAGALARESGVKQLLLTHLWPVCNRSQSLKLASDTFGGLVELSESGHTYEL